MSGGRWFNTIPKQEYGYCVFTLTPAGKRKVDDTLTDDLEPLWWQMVASAEMLGLRAGPIRCGGYAMASPAIQIARLSERRRFAR